MSLVCSGLHSAVNYVVSGACGTGWQGFTSLTRLAFDGDGEQTKFTLQNSTNNRIDLYLCRAQAKMICIDEFGHITHTAYHIFYSEVKTRLFDKCPVTLAFGL